MNGAQFNAENGLDSSTRLRFFFENLPQTSYSNFSQNRYL